MTWLRRLFFLFRRGRLERELREEMRWHVQQRVDALVAEGVDETAAREAAQRAFGNLTHLGEESRDYWGFVWLELLLQDVRHAIRNVAHSPVLTGVAVLSLGLSLAASCAVFTLAHATLFAALPVPEPSRLVVLRWVSGPKTPYEELDGWARGDDRENSSTSFSYDAFTTARDRLAARADVFGFADLYRVNLSVRGGARLTTGQAVSGNYFRALGIMPAAGRFIDPADDRDGAPAVAVISHACWLREFGGRADVVGVTVRINEVPTIIVGVAPAGFNGTRQVGETSDVTVPLALHERFVRQGGFGPGQTADDTLSYRDPRYWWVNIMARAAPGVGIATVQNETDIAIRHAVIAATPEASRQAFRVEARPGARGMTEVRDELVPTVAMMAAIASLVLVIACANLATLLLARSVARDREMGVRHALGASPGRLMRSMLLESATIGVMGGAVGLLAARGIATRLLPALGLDAATTEIAIGGSTFAFAFASALGAMLLFGLIPAWRATETRSMRALKDASGSVLRRVPRLRTARAILTFQVGMSVVVLATAGLLARTVWNLQRVDPGFDASNVLVFRVDPTLNHYSGERIRRLYSELLVRLRALPGVEEASLSHHALLSRSSSVSTVHVVDGLTVRTPPQVNRLIVSPQFFRTMRIPLLAGSGFTGLEGPTLVRAAVINRTFALQTFHSPAPLGHRFQFSAREGQPTYEVVGVVGDIALYDLRRAIPPTVYFSYLEEETHQVDFAVRTSGAPQTLIPTVRRLVAVVDREVPIDRVVTQEELIARGLERERLFATLASVLGGLALFLGCVGIYGVMAYAVSRRIPEIGVRLALGAGPATILIMVLREAAQVLVAGIVVGLATALATSRFLDSMLFGLAARDPVTQAGAVFVLVAVALAAALIPARRAARTDPLIALRSE